MKHHTHERHSFTCIREAAGVKRNIYNMIRIRQRVKVTTIDHDVLVVSFNICKQVGRELLAVLTVVRLLLIEVGVQVGTES